MEPQSNHFQRSSIEYTSEFSFMHLPSSPLNTELSVSVVSRHVAITALALVVDKYHKSLFSLMHLIKLFVIYILDRLFCYYFYNSDLI